MKDYLDYFNEISKILVVLCTAYFLYFKQDEKAAKFSCYAFGGFELFVYLPMIVIFQCYWPSYFLQLCRDEEQRENMKLNSKYALVKRVADGLEKLSIGALILGLFQFNYYAVLVGISCFITSLFLTYYMEEYR